jgi:predicted MPP superfamily phosphohydrolase
MILEPAMSLALPLAQILAWRFWTAILPKGPARLLTGSLYLAVNALAVSVIVNWFWTSEPPPANPVAWNWFYRPILLWQLAHLAWLAVCALVALLTLPVKLAARRRAKGLPSLFRAKPAAPPHLTLRLSILLAILLLTAVGYLRNLPPPGVERLEVPVRGLPAPLNGLTVALVADLHYGRGSNWSDVETVFGLLRLEAPDMVVLAGDLIDKNADFALDLRGPLADLKARHGVYAVLGLADLAVDSPTRLAANLRAAGVEVLSDARLALPALPLAVIGFDDRPGPLDFAAVSGPKIPAGLVEMVVTHRPRPAEELGGRGLRLYLTGQPHPGPLSPWPLISREPGAALYGPARAGGLFEAGDLKIVVAPALAGLLPLRPGPRPAIIVATLRPSP